MDRLLTVVGAVSGAVAVTVGAFGAHALRERLSPEALATFETGVRYHFYHVFGILAAGAAAGAWPGRHAGGGARLARLAGWLFLAGTFLFSGSLYLLALSGVRWLGAITPLGGVAFIAGWVALAGAAWRGREGRTVGRGSRPARRTAGRAPFGKDEAGEI
jgi:uncharacterized membrane protein YgdD (TMEM256/DUF423 family)